MKKDHGFLVEMIVMLAVLVGLISVMSYVYAGSLSLSRKAKQLNDAIILASNGAEVFLAGNDEKEFAAVFGTADANEDGEVSVCFNDELDPDEDGRMKMVLQYRDDRDMTYGHISVYYDEQLVYELDTGRYTKEEGR